MQSPFQVVRVDRLQVHDVLEQLDLGLAHARVVATRLDDHLVHEAHEAEEFLHQARPEQTRQVLLECALVLGADPVARRRAGLQVLVRAQQRLRVHAQLLVENGREFGVVVADFDRDSPERLEEARLPPAYAPLEEPRLTGQSRDERLPNRLVEGLPEVLAQPLEQLRAPEYPLELRQALPEDRLQAADLAVHGRARDRLRARLDVLARVVQQLPLERVREGLVAVGQTRQDARQVPQEARERLGDLPRPRRGRVGQRFGEEEHAVLDHFGLGLGGQQRRLEGAGEDFGQTRWSEYLPSCRA